MKNFCEDLFFLRSPEKKFLKIFVLFFFFLDNTCACVLGPWPWPRAFLSLASRGCVLGRAVLGLGLGLFCVLGLGLSLVFSTPPLPSRSISKVEQYHFKFVLSLC